MIFNYGYFMRIIGLVLVSLTLLVGILRAQPGIEWEQFYGDENSNWGGENLLQVGEDGYLLYGTTGPVINNQFEPTSMYLKKVDSEGEEEWTQVYDDTSSYECLVDMIIPSDGGFVGIGYLGHVEEEWWHLFLSKFDDNGDLIWRRNYDLGGMVSPQIITESEDGGFYISGYRSQGYFNPFLFRVDAEGDSLWLRSDYLGRWLVRFFDMISLDNNELLLCGSCDSDDGAAEVVCLVKVDEDGEEIWSKNYDPGEGDKRQGVAVIQTNNGSFVVTGGHRPQLGQNNNAMRTLVMLVDSDGNEVWTHLYHEPDFEDDWCEGVDLIQTDDGGFTIVGSIDIMQFIYLLRINSEGERLWSTYFNSHYANYGSTVLPVGDAYMISSTHRQVIEGRVNRQAWLIKTEADPVSAPELNNPLLPLKPTLLNVFPNPFNATARISYNINNFDHVTLSIKDINGKEVTRLVNKAQNPGTYEAIWNANDIPSGIYYCLLNIGEERYVTKAVIVR